MQAGDEYTSDVLVVGTGLAGLAAALALAVTGLKVTLAGPAPDMQRAPDRRTTALFGGNLPFLANIGLPSERIAGAAPLTGLRLIDDTGGLLRAPEILFQAPETGRTAFGANFENAKLLAALADGVRGHPAIRWLEHAVVSLTPGASDIRADIGGDNTWRGALVVGADGHTSICRRDAGITAASSAYAQTAVVARFQHSKPHNNISTELHRRAGPLTTVPLPGNASSLVWVEQPNEAQRLIELSEAEFRDALEQRLQGALGGIKAVEQRGQFPLRHLSAEPIARHRVALVGEAAHVLPPIGAQGLNLGLRDIAWLAEIVAAAKRDARDLGGDAVLQRYIAARRADVAMRSLAIDTLNRSLIADFLPADLLRGAGIAALAAWPWLRRHVMERGIGEQGPEPTLLRATHTGDPND